MDGLIVSSKAATQKPPPVTRDEAAEFCQLVKKRLGAQRLTRPFILRVLVGLRKNSVKAAQAESAAK